MSRLNKTNRTGRSKLSMTSFVALDRFMLDCPAYLALSSHAKAAYVEVVRLFNGENNGKIGLSARTLSTRLSVSKSTAAGALRDLQEKGFVEVSRPGGFNLKTGDKRGTEWRLTRWRCNVTHAPPSKAFMDWKPEPKPQKKNTVRPQAHNGAASGTQENRNTPSLPIVSLTQHRNAQSGTPSGAAGWTHIDIYHAHAGLLRGQLAGPANFPDDFDPVGMPSQSILNGIDLKSLTAEHPRPEWLGPLPDALNQSTAQPVAKAA